MKNTSKLINTLKLFGIIAIVAVIVFSMAACDSESGTSPTTSGGDSNPSTQERYKTYTAYDEAGTAFILVVTESETYVLSIQRENGTTLGSSTGTVTGSNSTSYTLKSKSGSTFTIIVNVNIIVSFNNPIPLDNGGTKSPEGKLSSKKPEGNSNTFVAITGITGVPTSTSVGSLALSAIVSPSNATDKTIIWSVKSSGTTGAKISDGNTLTTTAAGTVIITATIANGKAIGTPYTQDFAITVTASGNTDNTDNNGGGSSGLIGKWYHTQELADNAADFGYYSTYEFRSDGRLIILYDAYPTATYTATANTITCFIVFEGLGKWTYVPVGYTISGTVLTITGDKYADTCLVLGSYYKPRK